jgi:signal transduction histidine kinase
MKKPTRVLIVEDEMIVALDLERRLQRLGYEVCGPAATGAAAIAAAAAQPPDLVLMDICLSGAMDGIAAAQRIREAHDLPVIFLTANADEPTLERARATHAASYLLKPYRERELQISIELGLANHRLERELRQAQQELEARVQMRTAELAEANAALRAEIAAREKAEAQVLRAQRLESIGALASGIAHDLNNVLTPLMMSAQALEDAAPGSYNAQLGELILNSSKRGAQMVKQILLFVRGLDGERTALQPAHLVNEVNQLLRDTLPRNIRIRTRCGAAVRPIVADVTQLHQLLMNLCVNARDAMPRGGDLTIELENVSPEAPLYQKHPAARGDYIRLAVVDTGIGMPPEVRERIFTPFFTTKDVGQGTGLGLSTVQSIVRAHQGFIDVESVVGLGTRITVFLPVGASAPGPEEGLDAAPPAGHGEQVLLVDDEACVREITKATLEAYGYRVLLAQDGVDAIAQFARRAGEIAAVVTDQEMPMLSGAGCIRGIRRLAPRVPVLLVSGTGTPAVPIELRDETRLELLPKPFTQAQLLRALHRVLQEEKRA